MANDKEKIALSIRERLLVSASAVVGFINGGGLCLLGCYGLASWYISGQPQRTEAYEGFGDVFVALFIVIATLMLTLFAGFVCGAWTICRLRDYLTEKKNLRSHIISSMTSPRAKR